MHPPNCCPVALMLRQQTREEPGVQLWCVTLVDGNLWRPNRVDQAFDHLIDLCVESGRDESRAFGA